MPVRTKKQKQTKTYKLDILPTWKASDYINEEDLIKDMSFHIKMEDPHAYDGYDKLSKEEKEKRAKIEHHSIAKQQREKGDNVLSFIIAGSGSAQWNKVHKGFNGINEKFKTELIEEEKKKDKSEILNFVNQKYNTETDEDITEDEEKMEYALRGAYGDSQYVDNDGKVTSKETEGAKLMSGFRVLKNKTQTTVNLSGPLGDIDIAPNMAGSFNTGDYSIENLEKYVVNYADKWLEGKANELQDKGTIKPIHIHLKGHSRGGVAANESAVLINKLIDKKYQALKPFVDFDLALYDPVPGMGSYSEHASVDHKSQEIKTPNGVGKGLNSDPAQKNNVTVIYSLHSNNDLPHMLAFTPQEVKGANRVIMTGMNHNVGIYDIEGNHKASFIYSGNGEKYRGTGLSELPEGTFFLDERNVLAKVKSKTLAQRIADRAISTCNKVSQFFQKHRTRIMSSTIEDSFSARPEAKEYLKGNRAHNDRVDALFELKELIGGFKNLKVRAVDHEAAVKDRVAAIIALRVIDDKSKTIGKELTTKQYEDKQSPFYTFRKENIEKMKSDPNFEKFFSKLTSDDLSALCNDYDGAVADNMIKTYETIIKSQQTPGNKQAEAMLNKVDASKNLDPCVYAVLLNDGIESFKILGQFGFKKEKEDALRQVNAKRETAEGRKELAELLVKASKRNVERMESLIGSHKLNPKEYFNNRMVYSLAEAKMLGKLADELSTLGPKDANKELISNSKKISKAMDYMTEGIRSSISIFDKNKIMAVKNITTARVYNQNMKTLNELFSKEGSISNKLSDDLLNGMDDNLGKELNKAVQLELKNSAQNEGPEVKNQQGVEAPAK